MDIQFHLQFLGDWFCLKGLQYCKRIRALTGYKEKDVTFTDPFQRMFQKFGKKTLMPMAGMCEGAAFDRICVIGQEGKHTDQTADRSGCLIKKKIDGGIFRIQRAADRDVVMLLANGYQSGDIAALPDIRAVGPDQVN
ncbi:MAG: hypothetical protein ACI39W_11340 [Brotaphodocola sp.]